MIMVLLALASLPEPATKVASNPTPTGDIRSWIGIIILLGMILFGMIVSSIRKKKEQ
jgi:hypothetical protein